MKKIALATALATLGMTSAFAQTAEPATQPADPAAASTGVQADATVTTDPAATGAGDVSAQPADAGASVDATATADQGDQSADKKKSKKKDKPE